MEGDSDTTLQDSMAPRALERPAPGVILIFHGSRPTLVAFAPPGSAWTLGRETNIEIPVNDGRLSRQHTKIEWSGDEFIVADLASRNGTFVDGKQAIGAAGGRVLRAGASVFLLVKDVRPFLHATIETDVGVVLGPALRTVWRDIEAYASSSRTLHLHRTIAGHTDLREEASMASRCAALALALLGCGGSEPAGVRDACGAVAAGAPGAGPFAVDLSRAHASVRFFGFVRRYLEVDTVLVNALEAAPRVDDVDLVAYAADVPESCALPADGRSANPATVTLHGSVAWITPGPGDVTIPGGASAIVLDLRDLPPGAGTWQVLEPVAAAALASPVPRLARTLRQHMGMTDEVIAPGPGGNVYSTALKDVQPDPISARAASARTLVVVTGDRLSPDAAEMAITLRLADRAWLVGSDVVTAVAEMRTLGVGGTSFAHRDELLLREVGRAVPDVIRADDAGENLDQVVAGVVDRGASPPPATTGTTLRQEPPQVMPERFAAPVASTSGTVRAALIIAHGAVRLFFPYFALIGDGIDGRLVELLAEVPAAGPVGRIQFHALLYRLGAALQDGHNAVLDPTFTGVSFLPVRVQIDDTGVWVRTSQAPDLHPGDVIVARKGQPVADFLASRLPLVSAATEGYRMWVAAANFTAAFAEEESDVVLSVRGQDGQVRDVTPTRVARFPRKLFADSTRPSGKLTDLGAPELYYLNMDEQTTVDAGAVLTAVQGAHGATGTVVDMRGYPPFTPVGNLGLFDVYPLIFGREAHSARFGMPTWTGADSLQVVWDEVVLPAPTDPENVLPGPLVLLVGHGSVSAAEDFCIYLLGARTDVTVVGEQTAGTNGNITGIQLPGGLGFTFTGLEVRFQDDSRFHGVGIVPSVQVKLTPEDAALGRDPALERAVAILQGP